MGIGQEPHVALPTGFPSRQDAKVYFRYSAVAFNNLSFTDSDKTTWRCPQGLKGTFLPSAKNQMSPSNFLKPRVVFLSCVETSALSLGVSAPVGECLREPPSTSVSTSSRLLEDMKIRAVRVAFRNRQDATGPRCAMASWLLNALYK